MSFPARWVHGAPDCAANSQERIQVHPLDRDTWILRQDKCSDPPASHEGSFMYLLLGEERALLIDTGASGSAARFPIGTAVRDLLRRRAAERGGRQLPLVACHSHGHGDHVAGDALVRAATGALIVEPGMAALAAAFRSRPTTAGILPLELGDRTILALAIPGHERDHVALYDRRNRLLFTGDTLYPGVLTVQDWPAFRRSVRRLAQLVEQEPVDFVLGSHVEAKNRPHQFYAPRTPARRRLDMNVISVCTGSAMRRTMTWAEAVRSTVSSETRPVR